MSGSGSCPAARSRCAARGHSWNSSIGEAVTDVVGPKAAIRRVNWEEVRQLGPLLRTAHSYDGQAVESIVEKG